MTAGCRATGEVGATIQDSELWSQRMIAALILGTQGVSLRGQFAGVLVFVPARALVSYFQ